MKFKLENSELSVAILSKGAELSGLWHKGSQTEFMWQADPAVWGKHAPLLFPIIGSLKNGQYRYEGKTYQLPRHGFLRDRELKMVSQSNDELQMQLISDDETLKVYPFHFDFRITYQLRGNQLTTLFDIENTSEADMFFNLGTHPAFAIPFQNEDELTDYFLKFEKPETAERHMLTEEGLFSGETEEVLNNSDTLPISRTMFDRDALVFKDLKSKWIGLRNKFNTKAVRVSYPNFPYMGIWAKPGAAFVCIEPWIGCADHQNVSGELKDKEKIVCLSAGKKYSVKLEVAIEA